MVVSLVYQKMIINQLKSFIMKKTIIISAIALCFSIATVNAKSVISNDNTTTVVTAVKVSAFCISIAKGDFDTVKKLISLGEDVNQKSNGMTPAMYAAKFNRTEILELLIKHGAKLKTKSDKGLTALKYAEQSNAKDAKSVIENTLTKK